jgi:membrane associated rhomboid family serine protease
LDGSFGLLGSRIPRVVGLLVGLTLAASILGAVGLRNGAPVVMAAGALVPGLVLQGEVWRLVTWFFFEMSPLGLIFAGLALFWFGRDLAHAWGPFRFLASYLGLGAATGLVVSLLGFGFRPLLLEPHIGPWPLVSSLIVAWAFLHPHRDVLVYFVLPLRGRNLVYATLGGTLLFALLGGIAHFIPHFVAQGLTILYMRRPSAADFWLRLRYRFMTRGLRRRASHLRPVGRPQSDEPPRWLH